MSLRQSTRQPPRVASERQLIVSEPAWSGWRAYVDNLRVKELRANHAFLAVYVPAGTHSVRLRYLPQSFVVGRAITLLTLALVAVFLAALRLTRDRD